MQKVCTQLLARKNGEVDKVIISPTKAYSNDVGGEKVQGMPEGEKG